MRGAILKWAVIGSGSLVAAGALVTEGKVFPPGSLIVGVPARSLRAVTEEEATRQTRGWKHYVELSAATPASSPARPDRLAARQFQFETFRQNGQVPGSFRQPSPVLLQQLAEPRGLAQLFASNVKQRISRPRSIRSA